MTGATLKDALAGRESAAGPRNLRQLAIAAGLRPQRLQTAVRRSIVTGRPLPPAIVSAVALLLAALESA